MHQASNWEVGEYIRQLTTAISLIFWKVRWPSSLTCCNIQDTLLHHSEFFHLVNQIVAKVFKTFIGKKHQHWFLAFDHLDEFYFSGFVITWYISYNFLPRQLHFEKISKNLMILLRNYCNLPTDQKGLRRDFDASFFCQSCHFEPGLYVDWFLFVFASKSLCCYRYFFKYL